MLYEIFIRATDLLQEITAVTGSKYTVAEDTPQTQQDDEGYVAWWGDATWTQERVNDTKNSFTFTMPGYLQSPQVGLGNPFTNRAFMMQYAAKITTKFIRRPNLMNSSGQMLGGVISSGLVGGSIRVVPFPDGNNQLLRYRYTFTLNVEFTESNPC